MLITESKDFTVNSESLKEIRSFSRDVFAKRDIPQELKDDLVLAIAEAAQNIVKHAYNGEKTTDKMKVKILFKKDEIEIGFFDTGLPAVPENITHRNLDDIIPGGLGTYFIKEIMDGAVFKKEQKKFNYLPIIAPTLKIGEYMAIINPPINVPIKTIMIGSIKLDIFSTSLSNSDS